MPPARTLILHADDFGMNPAVNVGIVRAFSHGLLTSTSVLANASAFDEAIQSWRRLQADRRKLPSQASRSRLEESDSEFDLGIHLNLTQGRPLTVRYPGELLDAQGRFPGIFGLFVRLRGTGRRHQNAIRAELTEQMARLCDQGLPVSHLNGHQYIEMLPPVSELVPDLLSRFGIPVCRVACEPAGPVPIWPWHWPRWLLAGVKQHFASRFSRRLKALEIPHAEAFRGASHAGLISFPLLNRWLTTAPAGTLEIGLHPGDTNDASGSGNDGWDDPLRHLRPAETAILTSPEMGGLLERLRIRLGRLSALKTSGMSDAA